MGAEAPKRIVLGYGGGQGGSGLESDTKRKAMAFRKRSILFCVLIYAIFFCSLSKQNLKWNQFASFPLSFLTVGDWVKRWLGLRSIMLRWKCDPISLLIDFSKPQGRMQSAEVKSIWSSDVPLCSQCKKMTLSSYVLHLRTELKKYTYWADVGEPAAGSSTWWGMS